MSTCWVLCVRFEFISGWFGYLFLACSDGELSSSCKCPKLNRDNLVDDHPTYFFPNFHSVWRNSQFLVSHASLPRSGNSAKLHVCLKWVSISYSGKKQTICKPCLFTKKWKQFKAPCLKWVSISHSGTWSGSCLIQYPLFSRAIEVLIYSLGLTQWKATRHEYILVDKSICLL